MRIIPLAIAVTMTAQSLFAIPARAEPATVASGLSRTDATSCLADVSRPGYPDDFDHTVNDIECSKKYSTNSCKVGSHSNDAQPMLIMAGNLRLEFISTAGQLVNLYAENTGKIKKIDVSAGLQNNPKNLTGDSIDLESVTVLMPEDRTLVKDWLNYGMTDPCTLAVN